LDSWLDSNDTLTSKVNNRNPTGTWILHTIWWSFSQLDFGFSFPHLAFVWSFSHLAFVWSFLNLAFCDWSKPGAGKRKWHLLVFDIFTNLSVFAFKERPIQKQDVSFLDLEHRALA
jgi:hypothetical protein